MPKPLLAYMETQPLRVFEKFRLPNVTKRAWVNLWYCLQALSKRCWVQSLLSQADDTRKSPFQLTAHGEIWTWVLWSESKRSNHSATCLSIYILNDVKKWMETLKHFYLGFLFLCWQSNELISRGGGRGMWGGRGERERERRRRREEMTCHAVCRFRRKWNPQPSLGHSSPLLVMKVGAAVIRGSGHSFTMENNCQLSWAV